MAVIVLTAVFKGYPHMIDQPTNKSLVEIMFEGVEPPRNKNGEYTFGASPPTEYIPSIYKAWLKQLITNGKTSIINGQKFRLQGTNRFLKPDGSNAASVKKLNNALMAMFTWDIKKRPSALRCMRMCSTENTTSRNRHDKRRIGNDEKENTTNMSPIKKSKIEEEDVYMY